MEQEHAERPDKQRAVTSLAASQRRAIAPAQYAGLRVGPSDDASEQQADRMASLVAAALRGPGPPFAPSNAAPGTGRVQRSFASTLPVPPLIAGPPLIQRKVTFEWKSKTSLAAGINGLLGDESTFAAIEKAIEKYGEAKDPINELFHLQAIYGLCRKWLDNHQGDEGTAKTKRDELQEIRKTAMKEAAVLSQTVAAPAVKSDPVAQQAYMNRLQASRDKKIGAFQYLSMTGLDSADWSRAALDTTGQQQVPGMVKKAWSDMDGKNRQLRETMKQNRLTFAEATAIGVYAAQDYVYVNPSMAENASWLKGTLESKDTKYTPVEPMTKMVIDGAREGRKAIDGDVAAAMAEGQQHGAVALQGLTKLPPCAKETFRGRGYTKDQLAPLLKKGGTWREPSFASTSLKRETAEEFALDTPAGKTPVLLVLNLTNGRDITSLSINQEAEVLVLPGATFRVSAKATTEKIKGRSVTVIHADQVT